MSGSILQQQAPKDFFKGPLNMYNDFNRVFFPGDFVYAGRYTWLPIAQHNKIKIQQAMNDIHKKIKPTIEQLNNPKNLLQLQQKLYLVLKNYQNKFNVCHVKCRSPQETDYCADQLYNDLTINFEPQLKTTLSEY